MQTKIRTYKKSDYLACEALVNETWNFDAIFSPQTLANLAKHIYTQGSVIGSNYQMVVEVDGKVVGLFFGLNKNSKKPTWAFWYTVKVLWRLFWIKSEKPVGKKELLHAIKQHTQNRIEIVPKRQSEIVLFVIAKKYQQQGYGRQLWMGFKEACQQSSVSSIIVETNKNEASSFYEKLGFKHLGDFDSPLHALATKDGQACIYEYRLEVEPDNF